MRISGRNLNRKDERLPIVYKQNNPAKLWFGGGLLVVLLIVAIVAVSRYEGRILPNFTAATDAAIESRVISNLRKFHAVQSTYVAAIGNGAYGSFDDLIQAGLIEDKIFRVSERTYIYSLTRSESLDRFCIVASSEKLKPNFAVSWEGVIYMSETGGIACENGELKGKMSPLQ